jgi:hypothetical protein
MAVSRYIIEAVSHHVIEAVSRYVIETVAPYIEIVRCIIKKPVEYLAQVIEERIREILMNCKGDIVFPSR